MVELIPSYKVDPFWPEALPNKWLMGQVSGIAIDSKDQIWVVHRRKSLGSDESMPNLLPKDFPYRLAPPLMVFNAEGKLVNSWNESGNDMPWPENEHGVFIDHEDNVWVGGFTDHQVFKFSPEGKLLLKIGEAGQTGGSENTSLLGGPTDIDVDRETNEVYIADGYVNHRVIVFDASTGEYKRHWGAYGINSQGEQNNPISQSLDYDIPTFANPVHAVRISNDGFIYVCDRRNNRIQVFSKYGDFIQEKFIGKGTSGAGTAWDLDFSKDQEQKLVYLADGTNQCVWVLDRKNMTIINSFGRIGRNAGQFVWLHNLALDSKGNIYTAEVHTGKRIQKFNFNLNS